MAHISAFGDFKIIARALVLLALLSLTQGGGSSRDDCRRCKPREYCELTSENDIIVSGEIIDRTPDKPNVVYTVRIARLYKGPPKVRLPQEIEFRAAAGRCGLKLEVGEEYVVGLDSEGGMSADQCGPTARLDSVTDKQFKVLDNRGECIGKNPCEGLDCSKFQECVVFDNGEARCADTCAKGTCKKRQRCELVSVDCKAITPCNVPPKAKCIDDAN